MKVSDNIVKCYSGKRLETIGNLTEYAQGLEKERDELKESGDKMANDLLKELQTLKDAVKAKVNNYFLNLDSVHYDESLAKEFRDILNSKN